MQQESGLGTQRRADTHARRDIHATEQAPESSWALQSSRGDSGGDRLLVCKRATYIELGHTRTVARLRRACRQHSQARLPRDECLWNSPRAPQPSTRTTPAPRKSPRVPQPSTRTTTADLRAHTLPQPSTRTTPAPRKSPREPQPSTRTTAAGARSTPAAGA